MALFLFPFHLLNPILFNIEFVLVAPEASLGLRFKITFVTLSKGGVYRAAINPSIKFVIA